MGVVCGVCGKDTKSRGHIMTECLASHGLTNKGSDTNSLTVKESQKRPSFNTMLDKLRRVPMGKFLRDAAKEMEQMPFVLTKDGKAVAIVGPFKGEV